MNKNQSAWFRVASLAKEAKLIAAMQDQVGTIFCLMEWVDNPGMTFELQGPNPIEFFDTKEDLVEFWKTEGIELV